MGRMNRLLVILLGLCLLMAFTSGLKKKYLDSDGDGINDADDDDDDNDGIDDDDDDDDDGDGIDDDDEDYDGDGIKNKHDDDDGVDDETGDSGKPAPVSKEKGSAVEGMVFAYFFGLASLFLKNV